MLCYIVCQPSSLDDSKLLGLGVLDSNHRRAILHKVGGETMEDDFDNMLGDLSSVIKDLEMFSVVCVCMYICVGDLCVCYCIYISYCMYC